MEKLKKNLGTKLKSRIWKGGQRGFSEIYGAKKKRKKSFWG